MQIRAATPADHDQIDTLLKAAFPSDDEARLVKMLRAAGDARYEWVVEAEDAVTGCIILSPLQAPENCLGLGPVAATPEQQHKGIGSSLVRKSIETACADGWRAIFLLGNPAYYRRFGFSVEAAGAFKGPYPAEYMQALALQKNGLKNAGDEYLFAEAFAAL